MPVNSANELHELITTLSHQFQNIHATTVRDLHSQADTHINHVLNEGQQWITAEIRTLVDEWQSHLNALRQAEEWFLHHAPNLNRIAEDAARLASESFA